MTPEARSLKLRARGPGALGQHIWVFWGVSTMKQMNKNNNQQPFIVALECTKGSTVDWGRLRTPGAGVISAKTGEDDDGISRAHRGRHPASRSSSPPAPPPFPRPTCVRIAPSASNGPIVPILKKIAALAGLQRARAPWPGASRI